jgi:hypothetical protein
MQCRKAPENGRGAHDMRLYYIAIHWRVYCTKQQPGSTYNGMAGVWLSRFGVVSRETREYNKH